MTPVSQIIDQRARPVTGIAWTNAAAPSDQPGAQPLNIGPHTRTPHSIHRPPHGRLASCRVRIAWLRGIVNVDERLNLTGWAQESPLEGFGQRHKFQLAQETHERLRMRRLA